MGGLIIVIIGFIFGAAIAAAFYFVISQRGSSARSSLKEVEAEVQKREDLKQEVDNIFGKLVELGKLKEAVEEIHSVQESLKAERGRIMITQAELETVEARLRELEEIEREFEASGLETKQELEILKKKQEELSSKNSTLKQKLSDSQEQFNQLLSELELNDQQQEQVQQMQNELIKTQEKIDTLLLEIENGNDQYFNLKRRYDALDIEYAQLYEKFSESDMGGGGEE